jgi:hypothetical protein
MIRADFDSLQGIIRTIMTEARIYHKKFSSGSFLLPKTEGGVGITDMYSLPNSKVQ